MTETVKNSLKILTSVICEEFKKHGFLLKKDRFFEKTSDQNRVYRYTINLTKVKGWFSLHLTLQLLDNPLMSDVNNVLNRALRDKDFDYPDNWSNDIIEKTIKTRISNHAVAELTDWRELRDSDETLESFNGRFSIWLYSFDKLEEKPDWKEQLLISVELSLAWFNKVDSGDWIVVNTDYPSLYILEKQGQRKALERRYNEVLERSDDPQEVKLFYRHLHEHTNK